MAFICDKFEKSLEKFIYFPKDLCSLSTLLNLTKKSH